MVTTTTTTATFWITLTLLRFYGVEPGRMGLQREQVQLILWFGYLLLINADADEERGKNAGKE